MMMRRRRRRRRRRRSNVIFGVMTLFSFGDGKSIIHLYLYQ
jgi:hypothetical protein